jgi:hypothetical protein
MADTNDFSGLWHSIYYYTSSVRSGLFKSEYDIKIYPKDHQLIMESEPNDTGSYVLVRLTQNGRVATGTWQEQTSPSGAYEGSVCDGAIQLVLSEDSNEWHGMWVAYGRNMEVRSGYWDIVRQA